MTSTRIIRFLAFLGVPSAQFTCADAFARQDTHAQAFPLFVRAARSGLHTAQFRLGRCYLLGLGVPPSIQDALRWLLRAADAGNTAAQTQLAALALQGVREPAETSLFTLLSDAALQTDFERAEHWSRKAVAAGSAEAKALLAFILTTGPEDHRDVAAGEALYRESAADGWSRGELGLAMTLLRDNTHAAALKARKLLRSAAADNVPAAHFLLGVLAESGACGSVDFKAAAASYEAAAELGHAGAQLRFGLALLAGRGTARDPFHAETWLRRAALAGESQAAAIIGDLYVREGGLPPNYAEASLWFQRAAAAGHAGAARELGRIHLYGRGIPKDFEEALHWLRIAAAGGDDTARGEMAQLALSRQVGEEDQQATRAWFQQLADTDIPAGQFNLGLCLAEGIGGPRDDIAALHWFRKAAQTMPIAEFRCGIMLAEGRGCQADPVAARECYLRAAAHGLAEAEMAAGEMLANGRGGPQQVTKALGLFTKAAESGNAGAVFAIGVLMSGRKGDKATAIACFRHAAKRGHPTAKLMLARMTQDA